MNLARPRSSRAISLLAAIGLAAFAAARGVTSPITVSPAERSWEIQVGQQAYMRYAQRGEIVPHQSPLYGILDPIANAVATVADRHYFARFRFILLNDPEPNALAMPGGNVYVTTAMLSYLRNRDELAGVICHEVNHDIHHDMYNVYQASRSGAQPIAYERAVETQADRAGAYTCAKAGFNPWGMVWNLQLHRAMGQSQQTTATADHPSDDQRLADLTAVLTRDRATFGKFRDDIAASAPLSNAQVFAQSPYAAPGNRVWYPTQNAPQYPAQYPEQNALRPLPQMGPYPPPPLPACYPGC
jgi:beta-barrel assembly-enhancing protease